MKKLVKQSQETRYQWEDNVCIGKCTELIEQYDYDSEEEKKQHMVCMEEDGWENSGQVKRMIGGSLMPDMNNPPQYTWFGSYFKTIYDN